MTFGVRQIRTVAIIGGDFSGAAVAYHLASEGVKARILIFEPRTLLGAGLAYGGADPTHRINVPATRMSLLPEDGTHFAGWLETSGALAADPEALEEAGAFPMRSTFGRYVDGALRPFVNAARIVHVQDSVVATTRTDSAWILQAARSGAFSAHFVVIATTHPSPNLQPALSPFQGDARLVEDGLLDGALGAVSALLRHAGSGTGSDPFGPTGMSLPTNGGGPAGLPSGKPPNRHLEGLRGRVLLQDRDIFP
jgi:uncharacterized NAD(P)/FAD-binding protein YdhS